MGKGEKGKLLSFVISGRNDNYRGNFRYRITTCLNHLARNIHASGRADEVEVLVTDWKSEEPLSSALELSPEAGRVCRFIIVPPGVGPSVESNVGPAGVTTNGGPSGPVFNSSAACNAGLRRALGAYAFVITADFLMSPASFANLTGLFEGKAALPYRPSECIFYISRKHVPWQFVEKEPSLDELDAYLMKHGWRFARTQPRPGLAGGFGAIGLHASLWHKFRGFDEGLTGWGWSDIELAMRVNQLYPTLELSHFGIEAYDMEQRPQAGAGSWPVHNPRPLQDTVAVNDKGWGLGELGLVVRAPGNIKELSTDEGPGRGLFDGMTRSDLIAQLTDVTETGRHIKRCISRRVARESERAALYLAAWYSMWYLPGSYLEIGLSAGYTAAVVGGANPGVEIYGIDPWDIKKWSSTEVLGKSYHPANLSLLLSRAGFRGSARYITGNPHTAFDRLRSSFGDRAVFDLVLFRADMYGKRSAEELIKIIPHLSRDGALIVTSGSRYLYEQIWGGLRKKYPDFTYVGCGALMTGLVVSARFQESIGTGEVEEEEVLAAAWVPLGPGRPFMYLSRVLAELSRLFEGLRVEPLLRWPVVTRDFLRGLWLEFRGPASSVVGGRKKRRRSSARRRRGA